MNENTQQQDEYPTNGRSATNAGLAFQNQERTGRHKIARYAALRAKARIISYYQKTPSEAALGKESEPFDRAKSEWLKHTKAAIAEVEEMTLADFMSTQETQRARRPTECFECGQEYRTESANTALKRTSTLIRLARPISRT